MKNYLLFFLAVFTSAACGKSSEQPHNGGGDGPHGLVPITARVNIQFEIAAQEKIVDGQWIATGTTSEYAIQHDHGELFDGKPSYRFELRAQDNTIPGYSDETKGRAELSYCYATAEDFNGQPPYALSNALKTISVYHHGKGIIPQGCTSEHTFSIKISSDQSPGINTIFAQIHGMQDRTLVMYPDGSVQRLTDGEFAGLLETMIFKSNVGYEKVTVTDNAGNPKLDANGNIRYTTGVKNGYSLDHGGFPPLDFCFNNGYFCIRANSDRKWLTDIDDRTNASVRRLGTGQSISSDYKISTIAYRSPYADFPKDRWVTFVVKVKWSVYGGQAQTQPTPGSLDVKMIYVHDGERIATSEHIVDNRQICIGRNDEFGYYFKFGIYRPQSDLTISYNMAGYSQRIIDRAFAAPI